MTESKQESKTRPSWAKWMHVAGIAYAAAIWLFVLALTVEAFYQVAIAGAIVFTVATFAFVGGWGRYMETKR